MPNYLNLNYPGAVSTGSQRFSSLSYTSKSVLMAVVATLVFVFAGTAVRAQYNTNNMNYNGERSNLGLFLGAGADVPLHNLNAVYRTAPAFDAGVTKRFGNFVLGLNLGYKEYQPRQAAFAVDEDDPLAGLITYSNYSAFSVYGSVQYNIHLSPDVSVYPGINLGTYYTHYAFNLESDQATSEGSFSEEFAYAAPKLGISFAVGEDVRLGFETKYNLFGSASYNYNSRDGGSGSGVLYTSWAAGLTLTYQFP